MEAKTNSQLPVYSIDYKLLRTYEDSELKDSSKKNPEIHYVTVTPNKKYVVCGYKSGHVVIFDYKTGEKIKSFHAHQEKVLHIEFDESNNLMFSCGADGKIIIIDINNFSLYGEITHPVLSRHKELIEIRFVLLGKNNEHIYFGSQCGCLFKCDKKSDYKPEIFVSPNDMYPPEPYYLTSGIFSPDKKHIVFGSGYSLKFVNLQTGKVDKIMGETEHYINDVIYHPQNKNILATWSQDGTITYWNNETNKILTSLQVGDDRCHVAINKTGEFLATGNFENKVRIWDSNTKHLLSEIENKFSIDNSGKAHDDVVKSLVFTEKYHLLTGSYDGTAKLWQIVNVK